MPKGIQLNNGNHRKTGKLNKSCVSIRTTTQCVPKKLDLWISCTAVSLLQWNLARDILMTSAVKGIHNLPPHLSYVSTLPNITQQPKNGIDKLTSSLTPGTILLRASSTKPVANTAACMCKGKGMSLWRLWSSHTTSSQSLHTHRNWFFAEPLTLLRGRQHTFSVSV